MTNPVRTIEQERASHACLAVNEIVKKNEEIKKRYSSLARSFPAMLQNAGLGQALAFLKAKAKKDPNTPEWLFYSHLSQWIEKQYPDSAPDDSIGKNQLLEWLIEQSSEKYRLVTAEIVTYIRWLKRFAEAELPEDNSNDTNLKEGNNVSA